MKDEAFAHIRVGVQTCKGPGPRNLGSKSPLMDPSFEVKTGSKLQDWFHEVGVFSLVGTAEIWRDSDATLVPLYFFVPWTGNRIP